MLTRKEKVLEFRKKLIIKAAREVFSANGFTGATIEEISAKAEIARATLYKFFKTKEDLYMAVVEDAFDEIYGLTQAAMATYAPIRAKFSLFVGNLLIHFHKNAGFFALLMQQMGTVELDPERKALLHLRHKELDKLLIHELENGILDGSIKPINTEKLVQVFNHIVYGYQMSHLMKKAELSDQAGEVNVLMEIFFNGISQKA